MVLSHDAEAGTTLRGDTRPYKDAIKRIGMRWYAAGGFWYVPRTRGLSAPPRPLEVWAGELRASGAEVELAGVLAPTPQAPAIRVGDPVELAAERADRLRERAQAKEAEAHAAYERSHAISDRIPFGQPILVGHHSERRHRRDLEQIDASMRRSVDASKEAASLERRAESIERRVEAASPEARAQAQVGRATLEQVAELVSGSLKRDVGARTVRKQSGVDWAGYYVGYDEPRASSTTAQFVPLAIRPQNVWIRRAGLGLSVSVGDVSGAGAPLPVGDAPPEEVYRMIVAALPKSPTAKPRAAGEPAERRAPTPAAAKKAAEKAAADEFNEVLRTGMRVEARWTSNFHKSRRPATIVSLAGSSLRVSIDTKSGEYAEMVLPRYGGAGYSINHGVFPPPSSGEGVGVANEARGRRAAAGGRSWLR